jgi:hypothetical protein
MSATAGDRRGFLDEERGFVVFDDDECFFLLLLSVSVAAMLPH